MIIYYLLKAIGTGVSAFFSFLEPVTTLPFEADVYLAQGISYVRFLFTVFPPLELMFQALLVILAFKVTLKLIAVVPFIKGLVTKI